MSKADRSAERHRNDFAHLNDPDPGALFPRVKAQAESIGIGFFLGELWRAFRA